MDLLTSIIAGLVVAFLTGLFGWGSNRQTVIHGVRVRKTGKWIIIVSIAIIFAGLYWSETNKLYGYTLAGYGLLGFVIGRIVAWFQRV